MARVPNLWDYPRVNDKNFFRPGCRSREMISMYFDLGAPARSVDLGSVQKLLVLWYHPKIGQSSDDVSFGR